MRQLWTGDTVDHRGAYYEVENARAVRPAARRRSPSSSPASAPRPPSSPVGSATATGATRPTRELVEAFEKAGGTGPRYAQLNLCWAEDEAERAEDGARDLAERAVSRASSRRTCPRGPTSSRRRSRSPRSEVTKSVPCGPDIADELVDERAPVRRRRLRPPLLPPDRPRPGRLLPLLGVRAQRRGRELERTCVNRRV